MNKNVNASTQNPAAMDFKYFSWLAVLIAAGVLGNIFKISLFYNVDFIFGSIFSILILNYYGLFPALISSIAISSYTYLIWNHPYAIIIFSAEIIFIGVLRSRKNINVVLLDTAYWLLIGVPLVYIFYNRVMGASYENTLVMIFKQSINGISNVLLSSLLIDAASLVKYKISAETNRPTFQLHNLLINIIISFVLIPIIIIMVFNSNRQYADLEAEIILKLENVAASSKELIDKWFEKSIHTEKTIVTHDESVDGQENSTLQNYAGLLKRSDTEMFKSLLYSAIVKWPMNATLIDKKGIVVASTHNDVSPLAEFSKFNNYDRAYLKENVYLYMKPAPANVTISDRWKNSSYVIRSRLKNLPGCELIIDTPVSVYQKALFENYIKRLSLDMVLIVMAIFISNFLSGRIIKSLEVLSNISTNLPEKIFENKIIEWPSSSIYEIQSLTGNFKNMSGSLTQKFIEQQKLNEELKTAKIRADEANAAKSQFLAYMSHDIRTPINAVIGMTDIITGKGLAGEQLEYMNIIRQSAANTLQLINDILDFSKIEAGQMELDRVDFDLTEVMDYIINIFKLKAKEKNIKYYYSLENDIPMILNGDPIRLRQILMNLAGNAFKFTEKGEIRITVKPDGKVYDNQKTGLIFTVSDTGMGISKENQDKIFERFKQADSSIFRKYGGTGLGLSICRALVQLMEGDICLESEIGAGSSFIFTAKFRRGDRSKLKKDYSTMEVPAEILNGKTELKILVVDDDKANQIIISKILNIRNYSVSVAKTGMEAAEMLKTNRFDLILMDINLPDTNGYELSESIRKGLIEGAARDIIIIAVTASMLEKDHQKGLESGMNACISKPLNVNDIFKLIDGFFEA